MSSIQKILLLAAGFLLVLFPVKLPAQSGEDKITTPQAKISSEGLVKAYPDLALMNFTIITESPKAQTAAAENAKKADAFLNAVKAFLHEGDTVKSTGYRIIPLQSYGDRGKKPAITGYRASNSFQVKIKELVRLGDLIDLGVQQGVNEIRGPIWQHSELDALTREATVQALQQAKQMAEALAHSQGLRVKRLQRVSTMTRAIMPRDEAKMMPAAAGLDYAATPIEVGEQEIRAQVEAIFELE